MATGIRRRNTETLGHEGHAAEEDSKVLEPKEQGLGKNPLVDRGLELYEAAELSGFEERDTLEKSLNFFVQAAENGANEAVHWIGSFLDSMAALPASVVVPDRLLKVMKWITKATESERQVRIVAKSMFSKMAGHNRAIPRGKIEQSAQMLLSSENENIRVSPEIAKSKQLQGSVKRLMHSALLQSGSDEVRAQATKRTQNAMIYMYSVQF